jgi:hypothetical protein
VWYGNAETESIAIGIVVYIEGTLIMKPKPNICPTCGRSMPIDYRRQLADNIKALLKAKRITPDRLQARYLSGTKKGKLVSPRTITYILAEKYGTNMDAIAAIAYALDVEPHQLLVSQ